MTSISITGAPVRTFCVGYDDSRFDERPYAREVARRFGRAFRHALDCVRGRYTQPGDKGEISHFQALSAALSATVGLGNIAGVAIAMTSVQGQRLWAFIQGSRVEIRKVVWPTRTETTQTALAVFVFTLIMGLVFWALDSGLLWLTGRLLG